MDFDGIINIFKENENKNSIKIYRNHGNRNNSYGVKLSVLKKLKKKIKTDSILAELLWDEASLESKILAIWIMDPKDFTLKASKKWAKNCDFYMISNYLSTYLVADTPFWLKYFEWSMKSSSDEIKASGINLLSAKIATVNDLDLDGKLIEDSYKKLDSEFATFELRGQEAFLNFVTSIAIYYKPMHEFMVEEVKKFDDFKLVHPKEVNCKTPTPSKYIKKVIERKQLFKKRKTIKCY